MTVEQPQRRRQIRPLGVPYRSGTAQRIGSGRGPGEGRMRGIELTPKAYRYLLERTLDRIAERYR
jgi:hypothetical protein